MLGSGAMMKPGGDGGIDLLVAGLGAFLADALAVHTHTEIVKLDGRAKTPALRIGHSGNGTEGAAPLRNDRAAQGSLVFFRHEGNH